MTGTLTLWALIVAIGALNYVSRLSFIALFAKLPMPPLVARALRFVPAAMLTAIIVPAVVFESPGAVALGWTNPKVPAVLVASFVAWRFRSVTGTMASGMLALWFVQWALAALRP